MSPKRRTGRGPPSIRRPKGAGSAPSDRNLTVGVHDAALIDLGAVASIRVHDAAGIDRERDHPGLNSLNQPERTGRSAQSETEKGGEKSGAGTVRHTCTSMAAHPTGHHGRAEDRLGVGWHGWGQESGRSVPFRESAV